MSKSIQESLNDLKVYTEKLKEYIEENDNTDFDFDSILKEHGTTVDELTDAFMYNKTKLPLPFKKLHPDAVSPFYNYESDSGFDLHSVQEVEIPAFGRMLVPTGLSFDIKDGYEIQVRSKSGLAINQGLMCLNSPGTVDNGYTGEIKVIIFNTNNHPVKITKGMKIAQAVFCPVVNGRWIQPVEKNTTFVKDRGNNGFGSTGI